jgi:hypothetical protein
MWAISTSGSPVRTHLELSRRAAAAAAVWFRRNLGEPAASSPSALVDRCLLAGGESVGEELNPDTFCFFGSVGVCSAVLCGVVARDGVRDSPLQL